MTPPTFEEVDHHVQGHLQASNFPLAAPSADDVCSAYKAVRPILLFMGNFLPARWKTVLTAFTTVLDGLCP